MNFKNILLVFVVLTIFVGLSCICAADADNCTSASIENQTIEHIDEISLSDDAGSISPIIPERNGSYTPAEIYGGWGNPLYNKTESLSAPILDGNDQFTMTARFNGGTGYHWEISPETHGVDLVDKHIVAQHPDLCGSGATAYYTFHVNSDDYYVKLILLTPTGKIVDELDSDMIN